MGDQGGGKIELVGRPPMENHENFFGLLGSIHICYILFLHMGAFFATFLSLWGTFFTMGGGLLLLFTTWWDPFWVCPPPPRKFLLAPMPLDPRSVLAPGVH